MTKGGAVLPGKLIAESEPFSSNLGAVLPGIAEHSPHTQNCVLDTKKTGPNGGSTAERGLKSL
jgi:hypothetical protein